MDTWTWTDEHLERLGGETEHLSGWRIAAEGYGFTSGAPIAWCYGLDATGLLRPLIMHTYLPTLEGLEQRHWGRYEYSRDARWRIALEIIEASADRVNELATGPLATPVECEDCTSEAAEASEARAEYFVLAEAQAGLVARANADPDDTTTAKAAASFALVVAGYRRRWVWTEQDLRECEARCVEEQEREAARQARAEAKDEQRTDRAFSRFAERFASQLVFVDENGERLSGTGHAARPPMEIEEWDEIQAELAEMERDPEAYMRRLEEEAFDAELDRDEAEWEEQEEFIREWKEGEPERRRRAEEHRQAEVARQGDAIPDPDLDVRSQVCEECRPTFDAWRSAVGRLEILVETPIEDRGPDADRNIADAQFEVRTLRLMLELCNDLLCDGDGLPETWLLEPDDTPDDDTIAGLWADLAPFRPDSDCEPCGPICNAIADARLQLRAWAQTAARAQWRIDSWVEGGVAPSMVAAERSRLSHALDQAERFEERVAALFRLLAHCEATKCPDPDADELPETGALAGALAGVSAGGPHGAVAAVAGASTGAPMGTLLLAELAAADAVLQAVDDGATTRVPTQEMINAWFAGEPIPDEWLEAAIAHGWVRHTGWVGMTVPPEVRTSPDQEPSEATVELWLSGERIPPIWHDAAREIGWQGPVIGFSDGLVQPMPIPHQRDRFAIEEALRAWGIPAVGITRISYRGSVAGDPETGHLRKTTVVFSVDEDARPIDRRIPYWLRTDQTLAGVVVVSVTYHNVDGTEFGGPPGSRTEYWTGRINIWDPENNRRIDGAHTASGSVYGAVYNPLVRIHDEQRVLRRIDKLAPTPPTDPWADSTGSVENRAYADPPVQDDASGSKLNIPAIVGGIVAAILIALIAVIATSGSDDGTDESADSTTPTDATAASDPPPGSASEPTTPPTDPPPSSANEPTTPQLDLSKQQSILATLAGPDGAAGFLVIEIDEETDTVTFSIVGVDGQPLPSSQIEQVWSQLIRLANEQVDRLLNASAFPCGAVTDEYRVTCPIGAGPAPAGEFVLVGVELAGPIGEGARSFTYGLAFDDAEDDVDYAAPPEFDADFFAGTEFWYRLEIDEAGERQMRADGFIDGVPDHPRYSAAAAIEFDDTLVWLIPRSELPDGPLVYRATAFHNDGEPGAVPDPATSGGDISGSEIDDPLFPILEEVVDYDAGDTIPPDVEGTQARVAIDGDPDAYLTRILLEDFFARLDGALAADDRDGVIATVMPQLLAGPNGEQCIAELEASLLLADSVGLNSVPDGPDLSNGFPLYTAQGQIDYPTGTVDWPPFLAPGPGGRLYQLIGSCF